MSNLCKIFPPQFTQSEFTHSIHVLHKSKTSNFFLPISGQKGAFIDHQTCTQYWEKLKKENTCAIALVGLRAN